MEALDRPEVRHRFAMGIRGVNPILEGSINNADIPTFAQIIANRESRILEELNRRNP